MVTVPNTASSQTTVTAVRQASQLIEAASRRITTGVRVASPLEGISAYFDASALTARATALLEAKDRLTDAATVTGDTVATIDEITALLNTAKTTATAAKLGAVTGGVSTTSTGDIVTTAAANVTATLAGAVDDDAFTITYDGVTTSITNTTGSTFTSIAAQIDAISGLTATVSDGAALVVTGADGRDITITESVNTLAADLGLASSTNGTVATNGTREAAEVQFDLTRTRISELVGNATVLGTNLLVAFPDTFTVGLNESGGNKFSITGDDSTPEGLNLTAVDALDNFATDTRITATILEIDAAITALSNTRSKISTGNSVINSHLDYITELTTVVEDGASLLVDTNVDEETANLLALQTRHDLSVTGVGLFFKDGTVLTSLLQVR